MKANEMLQEMLEQLPTDQLEQMLESELKTRPVNADSVRAIMKILEDRDKDLPLEITDDIQKACAEYRDNIFCRKKRLNLRRLDMVLRVATAAIVLMMFFTTVPQEAVASSLWDRLVSVTDSILEFLNPGDKNNHHVDYEFKTDHPGLQQVYDSVVEMGISDPVIPTWIPEVYELIDCRVSKTVARDRLDVCFMSGESELILSISVFDEMASHDYCKDVSEYRIFEYNNAEYTILTNHNLFVAVWYVNDIECFLTVDCQEDTLIDILKSINHTGDDYS